MADEEHLMKSLQRIIDTIKESLQTQEQTNSENLLTNSKLNHNVNTFSFDPRENEALNSLTERIEAILAEILLPMERKSREYLFDKLDEYHYDRKTEKFTEPLTMNNLHVFLNDLQSTQASLVAFQAAWNGQLGPVKEFIENYPQFKDKPGVFGTTLPFSAARNNHLELVKYLIAEAGCSVNAQNLQHIAKALPNPAAATTDSDRSPSAGSTALHGACFGEHLEIVKYLLDHGADYYLTNHAEETPITHAVDSVRIAAHFRTVLVLGYSIKTDNLPLEPIVEGGQNLLDDCVWEYKPFDTFEWYSFSSPEAATLTAALRPSLDKLFPQEVHLKVQKGVYGVSTTKFLRSGRDLDHHQNLAWVRCRGSSTLNFDCYSLWQVMLVRHPAIKDKCLPSLEPFDFPELYDAEFQLQSNAWYNCPLIMNSQLNKTINYRQKVLTFDVPFIGDSLKFDFQTFQFSNDNKTIDGCIRWIPRIITIDELNTNKITFLDNFKPMVGLNPILMTSEHQKQILNKDNISQTGDDEGNMDGNEVDDNNYDGNLTSVIKVTPESEDNGAWSVADVLDTGDASDAAKPHGEEKIRIEDCINQPCPAPDLQTMAGEDLTSVKLAEAAEKLAKLEHDKETLQAQIDARQLLDAENRETHGQELAKLIEKLQQQKDEQEKLQEERQKLLDEQAAFQQMTNAIQTIQYTNIELTFMEKYLSPYHHSILNRLKKVSTSDDQYFSDHLPQMTFKTDHTTYAITLKGFENHHKKFKTLFQRLQSLAESTQSANEYYQRDSNRTVRALIRACAGVQSTARYWILYKNLFIQKLQEKRQEYLTKFDTFLDGQVKTLLIEKCISGELPRSWEDIRKLTNQFIADHPLLNEVNQIKHKTLEEFNKQNISLQRIQSDRRPTRKSAATVNEMITKVTYAFQSDPRYQGYELKHFQLIPSLLQRITIYYCCFALQLPLFESAKELLADIENHTVTTIATSTGSGKSSVLPALLIAEGYDKVIVTQPRRLPCQLISRRVNQTMSIDTRKNQENLAGWVVSGDESNADAKILYMTDGLLRERLLYDDRIISIDAQIEKSIVIFIDEVHERSINIDLCLAFLARRLTNQPQLKSKLKIVISSATLDQAVPNLFRTIPQIRLAEFVMPEMKSSYQVQKVSRPNANVLDVVQELYKKCHRNDQILCFVNSALEATENCKLLAELTGGAINARPLIQSQSPRTQQQNIEEAGVLFSTTIAETSLTFPSLKYVVDTGYINIPIYNIQLKRTVLTTVRAARSTLKQRSGRAGRTKAGEYHALYNFNVDEKPFPTPQICSADLTNIEFSLRRSPLKCGLDIIQQFLPDRPPTESIEYAMNALRTLNILGKHPSDQLTDFGTSLTNIPDFGSLAMSISVLAAFRQYQCGHDLICLSSILGVLNASAIFSLIPQSFKSPHGDFMTLLNIMNTVLSVKQSIRTKQFDLDYICQATNLMKIKHIIGPALKRYSSVEKSLSLSPEYRVQAHRKNGKWESIARALLAGYQDNVFISMREVQEKNLVFARYGDVTDTAILDIKSTLTRPAKEAPVPLVLARDVLYSSAIRSRAVISFVGQIEDKWMDHSVDRELTITAQEETNLTTKNILSKVLSVFPKGVRIRLENKTVSFKGRSGTVVNAELHFRKEMINTLVFPLKNRYTVGTAEHENLSRNLIQVTKIPQIFHPMIWRWSLDKQVKIDVNNKVSKTTCEITIKGRDSDIEKVKQEFDSFLYWLGLCAVIRHPDSDVTPRMLRPPMRAECLEIEERIARVTDSKRTRVDLYNATKGTQVSRETRMEAVAWIAICKFNCKLEGGFVRDWIVDKCIQRPKNPLLDRTAWLQFKGIGKIPHMHPEVVPADLDCHLPKRASFEIEKFLDELHKYGLECEVHREEWRYVLVIDKDAETGPFTVDLIEPHVALTHDRIDLDVSNLYVEKGYTRELGMRIDIQQRPYSIELESIVENIKKKSFRILRPEDKFVQERVKKMIDSRGWTQLGKASLFVPSPDPQYCSVLVPLPPSSVLYRDLKPKIENINSGISVKAIEQIRNPLLEDAYEAMKMLIARDCPGRNPNERLLYHGTNAGALQGITDNGFDDRYFSATGKWGSGAYFADNPEKSHNYATPNGTGQTRVIFYSKVVLGIPSVKNAADNELKSAPLGFHSVHGTGGTYDEYIVYRYGQALPYLKITYK